MSTQPEPDPGFSSIQNSALQAIAVGASFSVIARAAGIHRSTLYHWIQTQPAFAAAVEQARAGYADQIRDDLRELSRLALATLHNLLTDPDTSASVRLKAALAVLNRPQFPQPGWQLPEPVESPGRQQTLAELASLHAEDARLRMAEKLARRAASPSAAPSGQPSAASAPPAAAAQPPTAPPRAGTPRNAPCPCGSKLKFKRCCGRSAPPQYSNAA